MSPSYQLEDEMAYLPTRCPKRGHFQRQIRKTSLPAKIQQSHTSTSNPHKLCIHIHRRSYAVSIHLQLSNKDIHHPTHVVPYPTMTSRQAWKTGLRPRTYKHWQAYQAICDENSAAAVGRRMCGRNYGKIKRLTELAAVAPPTLIRRILIDGTRAVEVETSIPARGGWSKRTLENAILQADPKFVPERPEAGVMTIGHFAVLERVPGSRIGGPLEEEVGRRSTGKDVTVRFPGVVIRAFEKKETTVSQQSRAIWMRSPTHSAPKDGPSISPSPAVKQDIDHLNLVVGPHPTMPPQRKPSSLKLWKTGIPPGTYLYWQAYQAIYDQIRAAGDERQPPTLVEYRDRIESSFVIITTSIPAGPSYSREWLIETIEEVTRFFCFKPGALTEKGDLWTSEMWGVRFFGATEKDFEKDRRAPKPYGT
ncbi:hypothetical protein B0H66DRAFT_528950 [Apodospora peruviana]|uniref:Uncharacterized protein n=1 Tax=Apodospora peruviana TaxID=516989 RepID=A0AAE0IH04_9PEZI|nr:hypothetical protein B0H66DRAFT_528950 [Apodospora peruviana]